MTRIWLLTSTSLHFCSVLADIDLSKISDSKAVRTRDLAAQIMGRFVYSASLVGIWHENIPVRLCHQRSEVQRPALRVYSHRRSLGASKCSSSSCGATPVLEDVPFLRTQHNFGGSLPAFYPDQESGAIQHRFLGIPTRTSGSRHKAMAEGHPSRRSKQQMGILLRWRALVSCRSHACAQQTTVEIHKQFGLCDAAQMDL